MKCRVIKSLLLVGLLILAPSSHAGAQYSIDWFNFSGGGGSSTGGIYSIAGTIGQHGAGVPMSGGHYSLTGGFWSLVGAVQTPGAPPLSAALLTNNSVLVSWPYPSTGFSLEQSGALGATNWVEVATAPVHVGPQWQVLVSSPVGNTFYRLRTH